MVNKLLWFAVIVWAATVRAGTEELRDIIQNKIKNNDALKEFFNNALSAESQVNCAQGQNLFCPLATVPSAVFQPEGGSVSSSAPSCCPRNYLQCQIQQNTQYCRVLTNYTITSTTGNSETKCPVTTPACTCQQSLSGESFLRLRFCPSTTPCCPDCMCYGDPHCKSFSGSSEVWAICDSRDTTCLHNSGTCVTKTYAGQPCQWVVGKNGLGYCSRASNTTAPIMLMYTKQYQKYFTPADPTTYTFTLVLTLGTYGAITRIDLTDTGASAQPYTWFVDGNGNCKGNSAFPFNNQNQAPVQGLPSMVTLLLQCTPAGNKSPTSGRVDVLELQDPWFSQGSPGFGGYCATGIIKEALSEKDTTSCNTVDRLITNYLGCPPKTAISTCKTNWCNANYYQLDYTNIGSPANTVAQKKKLCTQFVNDVNPANAQNFLEAVCATSPAVANGVYPQDATACKSNPNCQTCMNNLLDYPEDIATTLAGVSATASPTSSCPDLVAIGLARKQLGISQSGIEIDFQNPITLAWTPVFALFDSEIAGCNCETLLVNGTDIANRPLVNPGNYRVRQCNGLNTDPNQDMCTSAPAYNTSVVYQNPIVGAVFSQPYGQMFSANQLICNPKIYTGCPPNYSCCPWGQSLAGWTNCMVSSYGSNFMNLYPSCKYPGV